MIIVIIKSVHKFILLNYCVAYYANKCIYSQQAILRVTLGDTTPVLK